MNIRQAKIVDSIAKNESLSIEEIKIQFSVSDMTARRDLIHLEKLGYITRVQGGAIAKNNILHFIHSFHERENIHIEEKKAIAKRAIGFINSREKIILDAGTTTLNIAKELAKLDKVLTIATTSLAVANVLFNTKSDVLIFGGFIRKEVPDLIGPLTEKYLLDFHADKLFIGCDGIIIEEGLYTSDLYLSSIDEKMVTIANEVFLVTDSSKFGRKSFVKYAAVNAVDTIITDNKVNRGIVDQLEDLGVQVILVDL